MIGNIFAKRFFHLAAVLGGVFLYFFFFLSILSKEPKAVLYLKKNAAMPMEVAESTLAPVPFTLRPSGRDLEDKSNTQILQIAIFVIFK